MRIIAFIFMVTFSLNSLSIEAKGLVERIFPTGDYVNFRLKGDSCKSSPHNTYWKFSLTTEVGKAWFAMLLSAAATKTEIKVHASTCDKTTSSDIYYVIQDF